MAAKPVNKKGVTLIIVVFAMMLLGVLGWTLAKMQATDFESNLRTFEPENALNMAESGAQYALNMLSQNACWRTRNGAGDNSGCSNVDTDCNDNGDWLSSPHSLSPGQYNLCARNPCTNNNCSPVESGDAVIEVKGYIPTQAAPRVTRQIKLQVTLGSFTKVLQAKNLFDWSAMANGSGVNGDTQALNYNRDNLNPYNEAADLAVPDTIRRRTYSRDIASQPYPSIDMSQYESWAGANTWSPPGTAKISNVFTVGTQSRIVLNSGIVTAQWNNQALRNITRGSWQNGSWCQISGMFDNSTITLTAVVDWKIGDRVTVIPRVLAVDNVNNTNDNKQFRVSFDARVASAWTAGEAVRNFSRTNAGTWNYREWGVVDSVSTTGNTRYVVIRADNSMNLAADCWASGDWIGEAKRYRDNVTSGGSGTVYYIMADTIFDVRNNQAWEPHNIDGDIRFRRTALVSEGDIGIRGPQSLTFTERPFSYPSIATQNGNIISTDTPSGSNVRNFNDLLYTENGDLIFSFLNCHAAFGNNITLSGDTTIAYDSDTVQVDGFTWGLPDITWKEQ